MLHQRIHVKDVKKNTKQTNLHETEIKTRL